MADSSIHHNPTTDLQPVRGVTLEANTIATTQTFNERYEPRVVLGRGGMGEVRLYRDLWIGREVAIKEVTGADPETLARNRALFLREARIQARLEHPAIVPVHDIGQRPNGYEYFSMKRVRGLTLADVISGLDRGHVKLQEQYSRRRLLEVFVRICLAIEYVHQNGVVHRDLKPSNIMLGDYGEVHVLDWGIARELAATVTPEADRALGTPGYMSPEELGNELEVTEASDIYALGAILFELLTLRPLHEGANVTSIIRSTLQGAESRPTRRFPEKDIPPEFDAIVERATALIPRDRFTSAKQLATEIERFLDGDRDANLRAKLAEDHAARAIELLANATVTEADYRAALHEIGRSMALNPTNVSASRALRTLFTQPPKAIPLDVHESMGRSAERQRVQSVQFLFMRTLTWVAFIPFGFLLGPKSVWLESSLVGAVIAVALVTGWASIQKKVSEVAFLGLLVATSILFGSFSLLFCALILVPPLVATNAMFFSYFVSRKRRWIVVLVSLLAIIVPFLLDQLLNNPPAMTFRDHEIIISPLVFNYPRLGVIITLVFIHISIVITPSVFWMRVRDMLDRAELKMFLRSWQLRNLSSSEDATKTQSITIVERPSLFNQSDSQPVGRSKNALTSIPTDEH